MKKLKTLVLHLKLHIKTRRKLVMWLIPIPKTYFSYPRNTQNLGSMDMGLGMKPNLIWVLDMVMRPKPKIQTQFFSGINECLILFKNQSMTCVYFHILCERCIKFEGIIGFGGQNNLFGGAEKFNWGSQIIYFDRNSIY